MSLLIPNTASQLQQSGAIPVINISGGLSNVVYGNFGTSGAVPIESFSTSGVTSGAFSFGLMVGIAASGRKMVQTNKTGIDDWNPNDQSLLVSAFLNAKDDENEWFTNIRGVRIVSGQSTTVMPESGFGLLVASRIIGRGGQLVHVRGDTDFDDENTTDPVLCTMDRNYGFDASLNQWPRLRVTSSGKGISGIPHRLVVAFSGDSVSLVDTNTGLAAIINSPDGDNISEDKQGLYVTSFNMGMIKQGTSGTWSRLYVTDSGIGVSGIPHKLVVAFSGDPVTVSGQPVQIAEGANIVSVDTSMTDGMSNASNTLTTRANLVGYNRATDVWSRLEVTASGRGVSGIAHRLVVAFSGDIVQLAEGTSIAAVNDIASPNEVNNTNSLVTTAFNYGRINDETNQGAIYVTTSGQGISGIPHRLVVAFSGDNVFEHGSALITNPMTQVPSLSGGVVLSSGSVFSVTMNSLSGNAPMWVGGTGSQAPFSGKGAIVYGGGSLSLKIDSIDDVRVFAEVSGQRVSWIGVQK